MPLLEWRDEFRIGIESVDFEHRQLIELINKLHERLSDHGSSTAVLDMLGEIYARISGHFALEETVMRDLGYDQFAEHKEAHEALLDDIRDIMDRYEDGSYVDYEALLAEHLNDWFAEHFRTSDARLHGFLDRAGVRMP